MVALSQKDKTNRVIFIIKVLIIVNILLALIIMYFYTHEKEPLYRAVYRVHGKNYLIAMTPLSRPIINRQELLLWAGRAAVAAYTYDVAHYQEQLKSVVDNYFSVAGGQAFMQALQDSGAIANLVNNKLVVTSFVNGTPLILKQGSLFGTETWRIQIPILVNYQSASEVQTNAYVVSMLIRREPTNTYPQGIAISQFKVSRAI